MAESTQGSAGVNAPAAVSAVTLARWQTALGVVLGRYDAAGLVVTDTRALEAYCALESGQWLGALLWLADGPVVGRLEALADPLGSLLAAVVLAAVRPLVYRGPATRGSPYCRAIAWAYLEALRRRPAREPLTWAVESLLRCGAGSVELALVEAAVCERIDAHRVGELVELHARDWEAEALGRSLGTTRTNETGER